jgi:hypothetical protein
MPSFAAALALLLLLPGAGCIDIAVEREGTITPGSRRWTRVYSDTNYDVSIDTAHLDQRVFGVNIVWYRTEHRREREHRGQLWNREVTQSVLLCDSLEYKVRSVDLSLGNHAPISRQRESLRDLGAQPWRRVVPGTPDEVTARAACDLLKAHGRL